MQFLSCTALVCRMVQRGDMLFRLPDDHDVFGKLIKDFGKPLSLNHL
jgi:hypothetical protein